MVDEQNNANEQLEQLEGGPEPPEAQGMVIRPMSRRTSVAPSEAKVFVCGILSRTFAVRFPREPGPIIGQRIDVRAFAELDQSAEAVFNPTSLGSDRGNLRLNQTTMVLTNASFQTKDAVRLRSEVSVTFRLKRQREVLREILKQGLLPQMSREMPRRVRGLIAAEIGTLSQRQALEQQSSIRDRCLAAVRKALAASPGRGSPGLGIEVTNLTMRLHVSERDAHSDEHGQDKPDPISEIGRVREILEQVEDLGERDQLTEILLALVRRDQTRILADGGATVIVVPTEQAGLLGSLQDIQRMSQTPDVADTGGRREGGTAAAPSYLRRRASNPHRTPLIEVANDH